MTGSKTKSRANSSTVGTKTLGIVPSYREAEARLKHPVSWIKAACERGDARTSGGRIDLDKAKAWIDANIDALESTKDTLPLKEQKLAEEVRKLRLINDRHEGKLIERAWVRERFHRFGGEINSIRAKSEAEDPVRYAEAGSDIALCRTACRATWDGIMLALQAAAHHFEE